MKTNQEQNIASKAHIYSETDFEKIYNENYEKVYRFILRRVSDKEATRGLAYDTFLKLWHQLNKGTQPVNITAYLFTIAKNLIFDQYQKTAKQKEKTILINFIPEVENTALTPEQSLLNKELKSELDRSISMLPDQAARIFKMIRVEGLNYKEVAASLNVSTSTVDTQLQRAIKKLRKSLINYKEDKVLISRKVLENLSVILAVPLFF